MKRFKSAIANQEILSVAPDSKDCDKIGTFCNCHCHLETKMLPQHKTQHASVKILLHLDPLYESF